LQFGGVLDSLVTQRVGSILRNSSIVNVDVLLYNMCQVQRANLLERPCQSVCH